MLFHLSVDGDNDERGKDDSSEAQTHDDTKGDFGAIVGGRGREMIFGGPAGGAACACGRARAARLRVVLSRGTSRARVTVRCGLEPAFRAAHAVGTAPR